MGVRISSGSEDPRPPGRSRPGGLGPGPRKACSGCVLSRGASPFSIPRRRPSRQRRSRRERRDRGRLGGRGRDDRRRRASESEKSTDEAPTDVRRSAAPSESVTEPHRPTSRGDCRAGRGGDDEDSAARQPGGGRWDSRIILGSSDATLRPSSSGIRGGPGPRGGRRPGRAPGRASARSGRRRRRSPGCRRSRPVRRPSRPGPAFPSAISTLGVSLQLVQDLPATRQANSWTRSSISSRAYRARPATGRGSGSCRRPRRAGRALATSSTTPPPRPGRAPRAAGRTARRAPARPPRPAGWRRSPGPGTYLPSTARQTVSGVESSRPQTPQSQVQNIAATSRPRAETPVVLP